MSDGWHLRTGQRFQEDGGGRAKWAGALGTSRFQVEKKQGGFWTSARGYRCIQNCLFLIVGLVDSPELKETGRPPHHSFL
jgi:hypothetical protein